MPLHYSKDGYTFRADAGSLTIEPGQSRSTLNRSELEKLGWPSGMITRFRSLVKGKVDRSSVESWAPSHRH